MNDVEYELSISRIFMAQPAAVRLAFADAASLAAWSGPAGIQWSPAAQEPGDTGTGHLHGAGPPPGIPVAGAPPGTLRLEFCAEPGNKTRLELWQGPYTEAQEIAARAWWDSAFSRLDRFLAGD